MGEEEFRMVVGTNALALDALAVVVTFGLGFLVWTLAHLVRESHTHREQAGSLFIAVRPRS